MTTHCTSTALPISDYPIWCKGCRTIQRFASFLTFVDPACYRVHVQCRQCLQKSTDNYQRHREDIKAARLARERVHERVACVCGVTINVQYREKHCRSKRHQSVVALLNKARSSPPAVATPAATATVEGTAPPSSVHNAVRSRYRPSLPGPDESSTPSAAVLPCTPDTGDSTSA